VLVAWHVSLHGEVRPVSAIQCSQAATVTPCLLACLWAAGVLWSISPKLVVFLLSYALLGTFGTAAVFGAPLTRLKQKLLRLEADLRFGLVRLRWAGLMGGRHVTCMLYWYCSVCGFRPFQVDLRQRTTLAAHMQVTMSMGHGVKSAGPVLPQAYG
jgi:hypothetical protein